MKFLKIYKVVPFLFLLCILLFSFRLKVSSDGPHGGTIKSAGNYYIEIKNYKSRLYAFLLDKNVCSMNNLGVSCNAKFLLKDSSSVSFHLKPFWEDAFFARTGTLNFYTVKITFHVSSGETVSAEFRNESICSLANNSIIHSI